MKNIFLLCCSVLIFQQSGFSQTIPDRDLKRKVTPLTQTLYKIVQLEPVAFEYNAKNYPHLNLERGVHYGFKADNMGQLFPELVSTRIISYHVGKNLNRDAKIHTIDEQGLIPFLVASIKEQQAEIEKLREAISDLKEENNKAAK
ncbi:MAG: tail fiber domain-containing protein [Saprospiraceae bacterium]|nr:tail fiber domain-containing protein [Saprospiraceae bacterium]